MDFIPGISNAKSLIQVFTGTDIITGKDQSRWISGVGVIPFLGNTVKGIKVGKAVLEVGEEVVDVIKFMQGPADTYVYKGVRNGVDNYVGITNNVNRRTAEHGERFSRLQLISDAPLTRGQAKAVEQVLKENNPNFSNIRNSISPLKSWYSDAIDWGKAWLRERGLLGE